MVRAGVIERVREGAGCEHRPCRLGLSLVDGGRAAELRDGVYDTDALSECGDANLGFEDVRIQLEEDVAGNLLL